ncbi:phosphatidate cytidylyltransferase [Oceanomicrobium pacificus]|uniref:Phosphatidate cytidylyltransferase n=1 Tax=Oceanomicrobium pacificus TaxID=2692916 RepID=A0A6B0TXV2_9RHOB|nr:phosphatidate cytidylyltransferase [Oceanomicrobium pacificus]MXU65833.1 phosphatidate cytidylyltransferase [Oceanomicrobium pacificus]
MTNGPSDTSKFADLGVRTASGVGLGLVALGVFYLGAPFSTVLLAAGAALMQIEYRRMFDTDSAIAAPAMLIGILTAAATVVAADLIGPMAGLLTVFAGGASMLLVDRRWPVWSFAGLAYIALAMAGLALLRSDSDDGFTLILWLVLTVVAADVGGYFAGRIFGGPKLWPAVSPKKTWSGAIGGWVLAMLVAAIMAPLIEGVLLFPLVLLGLVTAMVSQAGDLLESHVKRVRGIKDSGQIMPGHGGLLDRLDGLMAASLLCGMTGVVAGVFGN